MKLNERLVKELREGKCTLVADHSKPEKMEFLMSSTIPNHPKYTIYKTKYLSKHKDANHFHCHNKPCKGEELIPLVDFFEEEETGVEEIEFKSYKPKTAEERDQIVKELQAMEFKVKLPTELNKTSILNITRKVGMSHGEATLIELLRMRDVYRDGWVSDMEDTNQSKWIVFSYATGFAVSDNYYSSASFSFQDKETAELFLNNFIKELEQVKHLIS